MDVSQDAYAGGPTIFTYSAKHDDPPSLLESMITTVSTYGDSETVRHIVKGHQKVGRTKQFIYDLIATNQRIYNCDVTTDIFFVGVLDIVLVLYYATLTQKWLKTPFIYSFIHLFIYSVNNLIVQNFENSIGLHR